MQNSLFSTALTPIYARSRSRHVAKSVDRGANCYPRSSTPLRDVNTLSGTNTQQRVAQKSAGTACDTGKAGRKRKSSANVIGVREKVAKCKVNNKTDGKNDRLTSNAVSGHSHVIDSLAGELQQQKREELSNRRRGQHKPGRIGGDQNKQVLQNIKVKQRTYSRWKPVTLESIKIAMNVLAAAVGNVSSADSTANSTELTQLRNEIKQELQKLKVPKSLESYGEINELTKAMEKEVQEGEHDVACLSAEVADVDRCIKQTAHKLRSLQQHDSVVHSVIAEEEEE